MSPATGTSITAEPVESVQPVPFDRQRDDGWTPERQRRFLEELTDCGIIHAVEEEAERARFFSGGK